jgi:hypothetical protein
LRTAGGVGTAWSVQADGRRREKIGVTLRRTKLMRKRKLTATEINAIQAALHHYAIMQHQYAIQVDSRERRELTYELACLARRLRGLILTHDVVLVKPTGKMTLKPEDKRR